MYLINLLWSQNLEDRWFSNWAPQISLGVSVGMWVRGKGLASPPRLPLQWFHQCHVGAFSWDLEQQETKWEIPGYRNRGHRSCLPKELPRVEAWENSSPSEHRLPFSKVNNYCTGVSHLASAFGDSTAWKRNGWPCKSLVFLIPEKATTSASVSTFDKDEILVQGRICFFPYWARTWSFGSRRTGPQSSHHLPLSTVTSETVLVRNMMMSF